MRQFFSERTSESAHGGERSRAALGRTSAPGGAPKTDKSEERFVGFSFAIKRRKFALKVRVGFWKVISNSD